MKLEQLEHLLLRYGTDLARWPWWQRFAARRLLSMSAQARRVLEQTCMDDQALSRVLAPQRLPAELLRKLEQIPQQFPRVVSARRRSGEERRLLKIGAAWALACGMTGVAVGATGWLSGPTDQGALTELAFGAQAEIVFRLGDRP